MRKKIELNDSFQDIIIKMSEGNPGAVGVLMDLFQKCPLKGIKVALFLDDMNIRGQQIWAGYKDYCEEDLDKFIDVIEKNDKLMVKAINQECLYGNYKHEAVSR